jgi:amidase
MVSWPSGFRVALVSTVYRREFLGLALGSAVSCGAKGQGAAFEGIATADYDRADAMALAQWVARGDASPAEILQEAIKRLRNVNPQLNLLSQDHLELALTASQRKLPQGPFTGVPFLLKDLGIQMKGTITSAGSALHANTVATADSEIVHRFKNAGLVIFGKTNTPEFGLALTTEGRFLGDCHNPWSLNHSTGGSSGGAAAAVAAGVVPMAHATDGGGSIRVPATFCGLLGLKPTRGLTPGSRGSGMSVGHVVTRSVRDSALMLEALAGYQPGAPYGLGLPHTGFFNAITHDPPPLKIAIDLSEPEVKIDPEVTEAVLKAAQLLESLGHSVEEAAPGINYVRLNEAQNTLVATSTTRWLNKVARARGHEITPEELEPMTQMVRREGSQYSGAEVTDALVSMQQFGLEMGQFHRRFDMILQPVAATPAPPLGAITFQEGDDLRRYTSRFKAVSAFTHLYNMTGQPSIAVPFTTSQSGLPIGIMLSAAMGGDAGLLGLAAQLERANPWRQRRPMIWSGT